MWNKISKRKIRGFFKPQDYKPKYRSIVEPTVFYEARKLCWLYHEKLGVCLKYVISRKYYKGTKPTEPIVEDSNGLLLEDFRNYMVAELNQPLPPSS